MPENKQSYKKQTSKRNPKQQNRKAAFVKPEPQDIQKLERLVKDNPTDINTALVLAEHYYKTNQEVRIPDVLRPIESSSIQPKSASKFRYMTLKSLGMAFAGELNEAEQACKKGLLEFPDAVDFYYLLTYVKVSLRENKSAIECAENYLRLLKEKPILDGMPMPLCGMKAHLSQLENMLANAYRETKQIDSALEHYHASIEADPNNQLPYLNLATTYSHNGEIEKAKAVIEKGINKCRDIQDLRIMQKSLKNHRTISACMIVKNEEEMLPDCLASIRNWVDEIIVVDTGSTDKTIEIAESYGAKVFKQDWEGDFSKHRNYSIEQASSEWIFIIDADERICEEDVPRLRELLNSDQHSIISINVFNVYGQEKQTTTFLPSVRLFKRELNLQYEGIVHNRLVFAEDASVVRANVKLHHFGYDLSPEKMKQKFERSKELLEKQIEKNPKDAFALFNMAQLYRGEGRENPEQVSDAMIKYAAQAVELTNPDQLLTRNIHLMALDQLGWAYFFKKDYDKALEYANRAIKHKRDYLDPLLLLGHVYTQLQDFEKARESYIRYIEIQKSYDPTSEKDNLILVNPDSRTTAYYGLGMLHEIQNQPEEALAYYNKTAELDSQHLDVQNRMATLSENKNSDVTELSNLEMLISNKNLEEAEKLSQSLISTSEQKDELRETIAQLYFAKGEYREASKLFWQMLDSNPNDAKVLNDLANCYFKLNDFKKALEYYESASELPDAPTILFRNMGITCSKLKQYGSAIIAFRKYTKENPEDGEIYAIMADLYSRTGDFRAALPLYEKFLQSNPNDHTALFSLSECYLNLGHEDSARMGYNRTLELNPEFKPAQKRLSQLEAVSSE